MRKQLYRDGPMGHKNVETITNNFNNYSFNNYSFNFNKHLLKSLATVYHIRQFAQLTTDGLQNILQFYASSHRPGNTNFNFNI